MTTHIAISGKDRINDGSSLPLIARFRTGDADVAPTNAYYSVVDPDTGCVLLDWTSLSPATSITITITSSINDANRGVPVERRTALVMADRGLSTQYVESFDYSIAALCNVP